MTLKVPDLPENEPLRGHLFLGGTEPLTGSPYTVYLEAESERYGVSVRVQGTVETNESTGRVTAKFSNTPEQPFSNVKIVFKEGALAPIANPLSCGAATVETSLVPYTGTATQSPFSTFLVDSNGASGACASPLPFALSQSTTSQPTTGGASTSFTFNLARADGQQYLSHVTTTLAAWPSRQDRRRCRCAQNRRPRPACMPGRKPGSGRPRRRSARAAPRCSSPVRCI